MIQGCLSGGRAAVSRGELTDTEWRILNPLLPDRGERGPAIADKRRTMNGILWVLRTGAPWRDLPERYGKWNSAFVRFTRWSKLGVWDAVFETLASLGPPADEEHAIDSTIVRAHQHAAGAKGGIKIGKRSAARAAASPRNAGHWPPMLICRGKAARSHPEWPSFVGGKSGKVVLLTSTVEKLMIEIRVFPDCSEVKSVVGSSFSPGAFSNGLTAILAMS